MTRIDQSVAVGVGVAGALVDVTSYADLGAGVEYRWGRESEFDDVDAGEWSFTLDNADGRFTPDNPDSPLDTTLAEGAAVCWQLGDRLVSGTVTGIEPDFPDGESAWAQVRVTCDDGLGAAGRVEIASGTEALIYAAGVLAYWPLTETFDEVTGAGLGQLGALDNYLAATSFDSELTPNGTTQLSTLTPAGESRAVGSLFSINTYPWISFWFTPTTGAGTITLRFGILTRSLTFTNLVLSVVGSAGTTTIGPVAALTPQHYSIETATGNIYINGVFVHSGGTDFTSAFVSLRVDGTAGECGMQFSQLAVTTNQVDAGPLAESSLSGRAEAIGAMVDGITIDASEDLWTAPIGIQDLSGSRAMDALNDVTHTEQGHLYTVTTGTLTSPTQTVVLRERDRPTTVTATFDVEDDLDGAPELIRDITNLVSTVRVVGTDTEVTVTDSDLTARAGSKNTTETVLLRDRPDLSLWGQDRLNRGANIRIRVNVATIDAMTTATDRSDEILALVAGDRIRITGLPDTILGFSEWDGWLLGAAEQHDLEAHIFDLYLQPVLNPVPVFNAARFAAGDSLELSSNINAAVTSMSIASTDGTTFTTDATDLPITVVMDSEEMTVTAVTSATPQVFTITRGVNGTTAAAHTAGAQLELADVQPDDDTTFITNYCTNPQFEIDSTGMATRTASGGVFAYSRVASSGYNTAYAGRATITTATTSASIIYINPLITELTAGDTFWYAVYARPSATTTLRNRFYMFEAADGSGAVSFSDGADVALSSGVYTLVDAVSGTVDASRLSVRPSIRFANAVPLSTTIDFKIVCVTDIDPTTPFSGDTAPTDVRLPSWAGTRYLTHSYLALDGQVQPALFGF